MSADNSLPVESGTLLCYDVFKGLEPEENKSSSCGQIIGRLLVAGIVRPFFSLLGVFYNALATFAKIIISLRSEHKVELINQAKTHAAYVFVDAFASIKLAGLGLWISYVFFPTENRNVIESLKGSISKMCNTSSQLARA